MPQISSRHRWLALEKALISGNAPVGKDVVGRGELFVAGFSRVNLGNQQVGVIARSSDEYFARAIGDLAPSSEGEIALRANTVGCDGEHAILDAAGNHHLLSKRKH